MSCVGPVSVSTVKITPSEFSNWLSSRPGRSRSRSIGCSGRIASSSDDSSGRIADFEVSICRLKIKCRIDKISTAMLKVDAAFVEQKDELIASVRGYLVVRVFNLIHIYIVLIISVYANFHNC